MTKRKGEDEADGFSPAHQRKKTKPACNGHVAEIAKKPKLEEELSEEHLHQFMMEATDRQLEDLCADQTKVVDSFLCMNEQTDNPKLIMDQYMIFGVDNSMAKTLIGIPDLLSKRFIEVYIIGTVCLMRDGKIQEEIGVLSPPWTTYWIMFKEDVEIGFTSRNDDIPDLELEYYFGSPHKFYEAMHEKFLGMVQDVNTVFRVVERNPDYDPKIRKDELNESCDEEDDEEEEENIREVLEKLNWEQKKKDKQFVTFLLERAQDLDEKREEGQCEFLKCPLLMELKKKWRRKDDRRSDDRHQVKATRAPPKAPLAQVVVSDLVGGILADKFSKLIDWFGTTLTGYSGLHTLTDVVDKSAIEKYKEKKFLPKLEKLSLGSGKRKCENLICEDSDKKREYYQMLRGDNDQVLKLGDFVMAVVAREKKIYKIVQISRGIGSTSPRIHGIYLMKASESSLEKCSNENELLYCNWCEKRIDIEDIHYRVKVFVEHLGRKKDDEGSTETSECPEGYFHLKYRYSTPAGWPRFEHLTDLQFDLLSSQDTDGTCLCCIEEKNKLQDLKPILCVSRKTESGHAMKYRGERYEVGDCVYFMPGTLRLKYKAPKVRELSRAEEEEKLQKFESDKTKYPEFYRFNPDMDSNCWTTRPLQIGRIKDIRRCDEDEDSFVHKHKDKIHLKVQPFYRAADTKLAKTAAELMQKDISREIFLGGEVCEVVVEEGQVKADQCFQGKCHVKPVEIGEEIPYEWLLAGEDRFFCRKSFDSDTKLPNSEGLSKKEFSLLENWKEASDYPKLDEPLAALDIFGGAGGLSCGTDFSGLMKTKYAIEMNEAAADTFQKNFPQSTVIRENANTVLQEIIKREKTGEETSKNSRYPRKGEINAICGGPPCQGYSGVNRFGHKSLNGLRNNTCVATYLSFVDVLRLKLVLMENVKNMLNFKDDPKNEGEARKIYSAVLHLLMEMNYQCTVFVLQAASYGVAQSRRRCFVLATAPGMPLPHPPTPTHCFESADKKPIHVDTVNGVEIHGRKMNYELTNSIIAAERAVNVWDSISDLEDVPVGEESARLPKIQSVFQYQVRQGCKKVSAHVSKEMHPAPMAYKRYNLVPTTDLREEDCIPEADWRLLPNISVWLTENTKTDILRYLYFNGKWDKDKSNKENWTGICPCGEGTKRKNADCIENCLPENTLIPSCLPHTGNWHCNWEGLWGRVTPSRQFKTITTGMNPMQKTGRLVHYNQDRLLSVRECARAQGFPDTFEFCGSLIEKHRQIGNAVPPILALAIAREIVHTLVEAKGNHQQAKEPDVFIL